MIWHWFRHKELIGGDEMWVRRDHIAGTSFFGHPKEPEYRLRKRGVWVYIGHQRGVVRQSCGMESHYYLRVALCTGKLNMGLQTDVTLNTDGAIAWRDKGIESSETGNPNDKGYFNYVEFVADAQWYATLKSAPTAKVAAVRFVQKTPSTTAYFDFLIKDRNKRQIAQVLRVFEFLVEEEVASGVVKRSPPPSTTSSRAAGPTCREGPFEFSPDGTVTDADGGLRLSAGTGFGELTIRGFSLKPSSGQGYIVGRPDGTRIEIDYGTGTLRRRKLAPARQATGQ